MNTKNFDILKAVYLFAWMAFAFCAGMCVAINAHTCPVPETPEPTVLVIREYIEVEVEPVEEEVVYYDIPLSEDLQDHIFKECEIYGVDPALILAMIQKESSFRPSLMGDGGDSYGLMQIQPKWNNERMTRLGITDLLNPYQNVTCGIDVITEYISEGRGLEWALMAYNGGPSYANKKVARGEVTEYVTLIFQYMTEFEKQTQS